MMPMRTGGNLIVTRRIGVFPDFSSLVPRKPYLCNKTNMSKKKKKKAFSGLKAAEKVRREAEIAEYGRVLSLRPSVVHESPKSYQRAKEKETIRREVSGDFFFFFIVLGSF